MDILAFMYSTMGNDGVVLNESTFGFIQGTCFIHGVSYIE